MSANVVLPFNHEICFIYRFWFLDFDLTLKIFNFDNLYASVWFTGYQTWLQRFLVFSLINLSINYHFCGGIKRQTTLNYKTVLFSTFQNTSVLSVRLYILVYNTERILSKYRILLSAIIHLSLSHMPFSFSKGRGVVPVMGHIF